MRLSEPEVRPRAQAHPVPPRRLPSEGRAAVCTCGAWTGLEVWVVLKF